MRRWVYELTSGADWEQKFYAATSAVLLVSGLLGVITDQPMSAALLGIGAFNFVLALMLLRKKRRSDRAESDAAAGESPIDSGDPSRQ
jgi:hypothetical protein